MKTKILTALLSLACFTSVQAQDLKQLTVSSVFDYETQYVFRGKKLANSSFQPSVNLAYAPRMGGDVNAFLWTSQPIGTKGGATGPNQTNEVDLGVSYSRSIAEDLTAQVGYQLYWYPEASGSNNSVSRSHEASIGVTYDSEKVLGVNLSPSLTYLHDLVLDSKTIQLGIAYSWDVADLTGVKGLSIESSANLGWTGIGRTFGDQATGQNWRNGYIYWQVNVEADYKLNETATVFLGVHYAGNNDGCFGAASLSAGGNPQSPGSANSFWGGLGIKFNM